MRKMNEENEENTEIKGPDDFLYDITTSSDRITITLLDPETKEPVESKKEDTNAYISMEKRTEVPNWEVSWSSISSHRTGDLAICLPCPGRWHPVSPAKR